MTFQQARTLTILHSLHSQYRVCLFSTKETVVVKYIERGDKNISLCTRLKYRDRKYGSTRSILGSPSGPSPFGSKALATAMQLHFPGSHIVQIRAHSKMACLLSTSFTVPLCVNKEVHELDYALSSKLSWKSTITTGSCSCSSNKHVLFIEGRRSCQHYFMSLARFLHDTYSYKWNVSYYTKVVISGYWVGPDVDDGWGFVEAVIDQIT